MPKKVDLVGQKFSKLLVLEETKTVSNRVAWKCQCICGEMTTVTTDRLKGGNTKSCGCLIKEQFVIPQDIIDSVKLLVDQDFGSRKIAEKLGITRDKVMNVYRLLGIHNTGRKKPRKAHKATEKLCKRCQQTKPIAEFRLRYNAKTNRTSYEVYCLLCEKEFGKERYYTDIDKSRAYVNTWNKENRDAVNGYEANRVKADPSFKLRKRISSSVRQALKKLGTSKSGSILNFLPNSIDEIRAHVEAQFEPWMTWENMGVYDKDAWDDNDQSTWKWQLDHIIPQSHLLYASMEDENFRICWSIENLRPLAAKQNILDGNRR